LKTLVSSSLKSDPADFEETVSNMQLVMCESHGIERQALALPRTIWELFS
jgi:hypothetical protein